MLYVQYTHIGLHLQTNIEIPIVILADIICIEKPIVTQLLKNPRLLWNPMFHCHVHRKNAVQLCHNLAESSPHRSTPYL
jgi:hypothetical protein